MFQHFATILTLLVSVLHAGLGCCWHHTHACETAKISQSSTADRVEFHCSHHRHCGEAVADTHPEPSEEGEHRHQHQPCDEGDCVFVVGSRMTFVPTQQTQLTIDIPIAMPAPSVGLTTLTSYAATGACCSVRCDCAHAPQWTQAWLL